MADIWKIGQDIKAEDFYKNSHFLVLGNSEAKEDVAILNMPWLMALGDVGKANNMTRMCEAMSRDYDQVIEDQNDYYVEIDAQMQEIENLQAELDKQVKQREAEQEKLLDAAGEEGLSEEDEAKVRELGEEIEGLTGETNSKIEGLNSQVETTSTNAKQGIDKAKIATDYGETAIEKGQPLAEMKDKRKSFWRKTFGGWNKAPEREAGKKLVDAGNELLTQVQTSKEIESKTAKITSKKTV